MKTRVRLSYPHRLPGVPCDHKFYRVDQTATTELEPGDLLCPDEAFALCRRPSLRVNIDDLSGEGTKAKTRVWLSFPYRLDGPAGEFEFYRVDKIDDALGQPRLRVPEPITGNMIELDLGCLLSPDEVLALGLRPDALVNIPEPHPLPSRRRRRGSW